MAARTAWLGGAWFLSWTWVHKCVRVYLCARPRVWTCCVHLYMPLCTLLLFACPATTSRHACEGNNLCPPHSIAMWRRRNRWIAEYARPVRVQWDAAEFRKAMLDGAARNHTCETLCSAAVLRRTSALARTTQHVSFAREREPRRRGAFHRATNCLHRNAKLGDCTSLSCNARCRWTEEPHASPQR